MNQALNELSNQTNKKRHKSKTTKTRWQHATGLAVNAPKKKQQQQITRKKSQTSKSRRFNALVEHPKSTVLTNFKSNLIILNIKVNTNIAVKFKKVEFC